MGCNTCGRKVSRNRPAVDKRGNSLRKFAFLHPNQKKILDAEDQAIQQDEEKKN